MSAQLALPLGADRRVEATLREHGTGRASGTVLCRVCGDRWHGVDNDCGRRMAALLEEMRRG